MSNSTKCHHKYRFLFLTGADASRLFHQNLRERKKRPSSKEEAQGNARFVDWCSRVRITGTFATRLRGLVQGSTDQISKKVHGQTERCNEICVPILSSQEPRWKNCTNARHCMLSQAAQVRPAFERAAMLNALAQSRSAPVKGASEKGRGRGKGKGKGKGQGRGPAGMSTMNEVMSHVIPLITSLEPSLGNSGRQEYVRGHLVRRTVEEGPVGAEKCVENARGTKERRRKGTVGCVAGSGLSTAKTGPSCASLGELPAFSHVEASHGARRHEDASRPPA